MITFKSDCPSQVAINSRTTEAVYICSMEGRGLNSHLELRIFFWVFISTYIILFGKIWILNLFAHKFNNSNNNNSHKAKTKAWTNAGNDVRPAVLMTHRKFLFFFCDREHAMLP